MRINLMIEFTTNLKTIKTTALPDVDPKFREELELEIGGILLNMKSVIADDEKTRRLLEKVEAGEFDLPEEETSVTSTSAAPTS